MAVVKLPAIFSGIHSRKDRSYSLTFETRELGGDDAATLLKQVQAEVWLIVAPTEDAIDKAVVPDFKPDTGVNQKTPSQRLRSVLFIYWKQLGSKGSFDEFYATKLEQVIDVYKAKLDGEEDWR